MKFFRHVLGVFSTDIFTVGLQFLLGVLVARLLPPAERGMLALVMLLPVTLAHFGDLGISQSIVFLIGRRKHTEQQVMGNAVLLALAAGILGAGGLWLGRGWLSGSIFQGLPQVYLGWALASLPVTLLDAYLLSFLRARQEFAVFNLRRLASPLLMLLAFLVLVFTNGASVEIAIQAFLFSLWASTGLSLWLVLRRVSLRPRLDPPVMGSALRFGLKSYLQNLAGHLHYRIDIYLLALFLPAEQVAFYAIASSLAEFAFYLPNAVGLALFPRLASEKDERIFSLTAEVTRHTLFVTALIVLGLLAAGWIAIPLLYGRDYLPAVYPFMVILPGVLAMTVFKVLTRSYTSRDRQQTSILAAGLALAVNVGLNLALIPLMGVVGAALSSWMSYTLAAGFLVALFSRESRIPIRRVLLLEREDFRRYQQAWDRLRQSGQARSSKNVGELASHKEING